jgi:hypothetical protein
MVGLFQQLFHYVIHNTFIMVSTVQIPQKLLIEFWVELES